MFFKYWFPFIAWSTLIIIISSIPDLSVPDFGITGEDIIAHFFEYLIFGILLLRALQTSNYKMKKITIAIFVGIIFSSLDEYHQNFIRGRCAELSDLISDWCGVILSSVIFKVAEKNRKKEKHHEKIY